MMCPNGHDSAATDYCDTCGATMGAASTSSGLPPADADEPSPAPAQPPDAAAVQATPADADEGSAGAGDAGDATCPNCGAPNAPDALFCEACGYDYTTGSMPRGAEPSAGGGENGSAAPGTGEAAAAGSAASTPASTAPANASRSLPDPWVAEVWIDPAWYANQGSPDPLPSAGPPDVVALRNTSLLIGRESTSRGIHPDIDCGTDNGVSRRHAQLTTDGTRWWVEDLESSNGTYVGETVGDLPTASLPPHRKREISADDRLYVGSWTRIVIRPSSEDEVDALA